MSDTPVPYDPEDHSDIVLAFEKKFFAACGNAAQCATLAHELARAVAIRERRCIDPDGQVFRAYRSVIGRCPAPHPTFRQFMQSVVQKGTDPARMSLSFWIAHQNAVMKEQARVDPH